MRWISDSTVSWFDARDLCSDLGARLWEPRTRDEMESARIIAQELGTSIWIGGADLQTEGSWLWDSDGEDIQFLNEFWAQTQPNGVDRENCLEIGGLGCGDFDCSFVQQFLCEFQ